MQTLCTSLGQPNFELDCKSEFYADFHDSESKTKTDVRSGNPLNKCSLNHTLNILFKGEYRWLCTRIL